MQTLTPWFEVIEQRVLLSVFGDGPTPAVHDGPSVQVVLPVSHALLGDGVGRIAGVKWLDTNGNGLREPGEPTVPDTRVFLDVNNNGSLDKATVTVGSTDVPVSTVDLQTVISQLLITPPGALGPDLTLLDVDVSLDITHGLDAELDLFLLSPNGTRVELFTDVGSSGRDFTNTVLDDDAPTSIADRLAPFTGRFAPEGTLSDFVGENPSGIWALEIGDDQTNTVGQGQLNAWSLTLTIATEPAVLTDAAGEYAFNDLPTGDYTLREVVPDGFTQTFPASGVGGGPGGYAVSLTDGQIIDGIEFGNRRVVGDIRGVVFDDFNGSGDLNGGGFDVFFGPDSLLPGQVVFLDLDNDGSLATQSKTFSSSDVPIAIPDLSPGVALGDGVTSTLQVAGAGSALLDVDVTLNIAHPFTRDLRFQLISPSGTIVPLVSSAGALAPVQQDFVDTTLDDEAATDIRDVGAPFTGRFRPIESLAALDGERPNGVWQLELIDNGVGDQGVLNDWSLTLTTATEPATFTDADGAFAINDIPAGDYVVNTAARPGFTRTTPAQSVVVDEGQTVAGLHLGLRGDTSTLSGTVFNDLDGDGKQDANEPGIDGIELVLIDRRTGNFQSIERTKSESFETDLNGDGELETVTLAGRYTFEDVPLGDYDVRQREHPSVTTYTSLITGETVFVPTLDGVTITTPTLAFAQPRLTTGVAPNAVVTADLNADGADDLIVTNSDDDTIDVRLNLGDGTFGPAVTHAVGDFPNAVAAGDLDGDGDRDVVVTNASSNDVTVLLNDGAGGLVVSNSVLVGLGPNSAVLGDVDNDGDLDVAVVNLLERFDPDDASQATISVLLNNGDGTFAPQVKSPAGFLPRSLQLGDVDGDGDLDAAMGSFDDRFVTLLNNNGDGTFVIETQIDPAAAALDSPQDMNATARSVVLEDVNGDGLADLVSVSNQVDVNGAFATVLVSINEGGFGFARPQGVLIARESSLSIDVADVTGDGSADLVVANVDRDTLTVLANPGDGRFSTLNATTVRPGNDPARVTVGDLDGDGTGDIATLNRGDGAVSVLLSQPGVHRVTLDEPGDVSGIDFGDFSRPSVGGVQFVDRDGDGRRDRDEPTLPGVTVSLLDERRRVVAEQLTDAFGAYRFEGVDPGVYLVEQDLPDGFVTTFPSQTLFAPGLLTDTALGPRAIVSADFDLDGDLDAAVASRGPAGAPGSGGRVAVLLNAAGRLAGESIHTVGDDPLAIVAGDFNSDGAPDLATADGSSNTVSILLNDGAGGFGNATSIAAGNLPSALVAFDVDGDGDTDLAGTVFGGHRVFVMVNDGMGQFTQGSLIDLPSPASGAAGPIALTAFDVEGDGDLDLAVANFRSDRVAVLTNTGGVFAVTQGLKVGARPLSIVSADFDGDGDDDLAVAESADGLVAIIENDGGVLKGHSRHALGGQPGGLVAGDLDGDGDADIAAALTVAQLEPGEPLNGAVAFLTNQGNGDFEDVQLFASVGGPSALTSGDFDGDGGVDLLVADGVTSTAGLMLNTRGEYAFRAIGGLDLGGFDFGSRFEGPDLSVSLGESFDTDNPFVPGDALHVPVVVTNTGTTTIRATVPLEVVFSDDGQIDAGDTRVARIENVALNLAPGRSRTVNVTMRLTDAVTPGRYALLAQVDENDVVDEITDLNNVGGRPIDVVWQFGQVGTRRNVRLMLGAFDNVTATYQLAGPGTGQVERDEFGGMLLTLTETTTRSSVFVRPDNATSGMALYGITSSSPLRGLIAPSVDLFGDASFDGSITTLVMRDANEHSTITVGDPTNARGSLTARFRVIVGMEFDSLTPVRSLTAWSWSRIAGSQPRLTAPSIGLLNITGNRRAINDGNLHADVETTDPNGLFSTRIRVAGLVEPVDWSIAGRLASLFIGDTLDHGATIWADVLPRFVSIDGVRVEVDDDARFVGGV